MNAREAINEWKARRAAVRSSRVRLGVDGYVMVAAVLASKPATSRDLGARADIGHMAARRFTTSMHMMRRIHISGWKMVRCGYVAIFTWGPGEDAPCPVARPRICTVRRLCPSMAHFEAFLKAIEPGPISTIDITRETGLHADTVRRAVDATLATGLGHIADWTAADEGGNVRPKIVLGRGANVPKPGRYEILRRKRERQGQWRSQARPFEQLLQALAPGRASNDTTAAEAAEGSNHHGHRHRDR